jgi:conserved oligomeric Golgi complex subunit 4
MQVLLNDLDVSASHTDRLIKDVVSSPSIEQNFLPHEHQPVKDALSSFLALVPRFKSILRVRLWRRHIDHGVNFKVTQAGIEQLFNQLMRPKLRTLVTDIYRDVSYVLDDDNYAQAEYQDIVRKRFIKSWESLVDGYKVCDVSFGVTFDCRLRLAQDTFTDTNYRLFFGLALDVLLRPWEKVVISFRFTEVSLPWQVDFFFFFPVNQF